MWSIKRILSLFKEPKQHILCYEYMFSFNVIYFKQRDNLVVYKAYPGLEETLKNMSNLHNNPHTCTAYLSVLQKELNSVQNLCDALGVTLHGSIYERH